MTKSERTIRAPPQLWIYAIPVKDVPVPALTLLKQQISATPPGAIVAASVT